MVGAHGSGGRWRSTSAAVKRGRGGELRGRGGAPAHPEREEGLGGAGDWRGRRQTARRGGGEADGVEHAGVDSRLPGSIPPVGKERRSRRRRWWSRLGSGRPEMAVRCGGRWTGRSSIRVPVREKKEREQGRERQGTVRCPPYPPEGGQGIDAGEATVVMVPVASLVPQ